MKDAPAKIVLPKPLQTAMLRFFLSATRARKKSQSKQATNHPPTFNESGKRE